MRFLAYLALTMTTLALAACPQGEPATDGHQPADTGVVNSDGDLWPGPAAAPADTADTPPDDPAPTDGIPPDAVQLITEPLDVEPGDSGPGEGVSKQLIILFSGDTLSIPLPHQDFEPSQGGLCALTAGITDYQGHIVRYNRTRVINEGGDPEDIKADFARGLLGEHPYILVDYGGWSRPNDFAGEYYVGPYLEMFQALQYTAVGCRMYEQLAPEHWGKYRGVAPEGLEILASAGEPRGEALPTVRCVERAVHGVTWRIFCLPLPDTGGDFDAQVEELLADWEALAAEYDPGPGRPAIVLCSGAPNMFYRGVAGDPRLTVVVGGRTSESVKEGYGDVTGNGPVILPEVKPGGRSIGACHLYYHDDADYPDMYFFTTWLCEDDPERPLPFRKQVNDAVYNHREAVAGARVGDGGTGE